MVHAIDHETRLKPRLYGNQDLQTRNVEARQTGDNLSTWLDEEIDSIARAPEPLPHRRSATDIVQRTALPRGYADKYWADRHRNGNYQDAGTGYVTDEGFQMDRNATLDRYEPLRISGVAMTEASIGGYKLDLAKTVEQVSRFAPLPPVCLSIIFADNRLNFLHHFFNGLDLIMGRKFIAEMERTTRCSEGDQKQVAPIIHKVISAGPEEGDSPQVILAKRVLKGTFAPLPRSTMTSAPDRFEVVANLWGFNYIEAGMTCNESVLKMWLYMAYSDYRRDWFNAFKSSGIPAFAMDGVQERYEAETKEPEPPVTRAAAVPSEHQKTLEDILDMVSLQAKENSERIRRRNEGRRERHRPEEKKKRSSIWSSDR